MSNSPTAVEAVSANTPRVEVILAGAAAAFSDKGFAATSMREIAQRTGASLGSIYYHFANKDDILRALICDNFRRVDRSLVARLEGVDDPRRCIEIFIDNHVQFFARHLAEMRVMSHELDTLTGAAGEATSQVRDAYSARALEILARLRPDLRVAELRIQALCMFGMLNWTYRWFHTIPPEIGAGGIARRMTALFLGGFLAVADSEE